MAVADRATLAEVGKTYAKAILAETAVKQFRARAHRDYFELWLVVTDRIDADTERRLYGAEDVLYDRFPEANIRLHVLNPRHFDPFEPSEIIPPDAVEIPLHHA